MYTIGRGRYARETYPVPANQAVAAFENRYLIDPAGPLAPDPFTPAGAEVVVAAVTVTRKASGFFQVGVQMPSTLASAATQEWAAAMFFGSTASGGTLSGAWRLAIGSAVTVSVPTGASAMGFQEQEQGAGNLITTITLTGVNANPVPAGVSTIVVGGLTVGSNVLITPGVFLAYAYELP